MVDALTEVLPKTFVRLIGDQQPTQWLYGHVNTHIGPVFLVFNHHQIAFLGFFERDEIANCLDEVSDFPFVNELVEDTEAAFHLIDSIINPNQTSHLELVLAGTGFQLQVWKKLLTVGFGAKSTYSQLASLIGKPRASRAVGTAIGKNPVSLLIPCHRIVAKGSGLGGYRWGIEQKKRILEWEGQVGRKVIAYRRS